MTTQTTTRFRADQVGSLLRPQALLDARAAHRAGQLDATGLRAVENRAILDVVAMQEEVGLDVVTDGDFRRETFMSDLPSAVDGFVADEVTTTWKDATGHAHTESRATTLVVGGRLSPRRRLTAEMASFLAEHAHRPFKITLPSPALYYGLGDSYKSGVTDRVYPDRAALLADVVKIIRDEVTALVADGVAYIQLDNPRYTRLIDQEAREEFRALGVDPDRELDDMIAADNACIDGLDRSERTFGIHLCRGNSRSRWNYEGSYEDIAERIFHTLAFDTLLLEYDDDRSGGFEPLRFVPGDKTVVLGLVTTKTPRLERREDLERRIEEAAQYVALERLALSPQCGFASVAAGNLLTEDDQRRKLELLVETAEHIWGRRSVEPAVTRGSPDLPVAFDSRRPTGAGPTSAGGDGSSHARSLQSMCRGIDPDDLRRYAQLVLEVGLAFPAGKELAINAQLEHAPLARAICEEAYARGASFVDVWYWDPHTKASRLRHAPTETLTRVPEWLDERYRLLGKRQGAVVNIVGDGEPGLLRDADPERAGLDRMPRISSRFAVQLAGLVEFVTIPYPTAGWAQRVLGRPDEVALWRELRALLRLDADDPAREWRDRVDLLERRCRVLNDLHFDSLRYRGPGTDLLIGLHPRHVWGAARVRSRAGLVHVPALPTEEIFSMPDPRRADGRVASTKPLELGGAVVEGLRLRFESGRIVEADADRGAEVVRANLDMDAGARRLGEVALVDGSSQVARSGLTFWKTLLDESAVCHLAWGAAIPDSHADYDPSRPESARRLGLNESATHVDFMVGGPDVTVSGVHADGSEQVILAGDEWRLGD